MLVENSQFEPTWTKII